MPESLRGRLLIAGKSLRDPNFFQTVVLILDHGDGGALGVVVNRPSQVRLSTALSQHFDLPENDVNIYYGGPVESSALFILHDGKWLHGDEKSVVPGVYVGSSAGEFESVLRAALRGEEQVRFRVFSGCAGWGPGQLEAELSRADWHIQPATREAILYDDPYAAWESLLKSAYSQQRLLPKLEGDPGLN
jgi:putative transcriptional regulator